MGPFARFYKLNEDKQKRILDNALEEFVAHGFENASLNAIIAKSEISKGSFYYYFEDKIDLFVTVLRSQVDIVHMVEQSGLLVCEDAQMFWQNIERMIQGSIHAATVQPHFVKLGMLFHQLDEKTKQQGQMAIYMEELVDVVIRTIERGQQVGAIRNDMPTRVILQLWFAIDAVIGNWALTAGFHPEEPESRCMVEVSFDLFKNAFMPPGSRYSLPLESSNKRSNR